jgi:hypothetical protein
MRAREREARERVRGPRLHVGREVQRRLDGRRGQRRGGPAACHARGRVAQQFPSGPVQPCTIACASLKTCGRETWAAENTARRRTTHPRRSSRGSGF